MKSQILATSSVLKDLVNFQSAIEEWTDNKTCGQCRALEFLTWACMGRVCCFKINELEHNIA